MTVYGLISKEEYFKYGLRNKLADDLSWYFEILTIRPETKDINNLSNNSVFVYNGKHYTVINNNVYEIKDKLDPKEPLINIKDTFTITKEDLANVSEPMVTSYGRAILNYVLLANNFGNRIGYINTPTSTGHIEDLVCRALRTDLITVKEYHNFVNSCSFLENFSKIVTVTATYKNLVGPEGLDKFKKDLKIEYDKDYGKDWKKDRVLVGKFMERLKEFDKEYLKDDPAFNKTLTKKIQTNARAKMYLGFGYEEGMNNKDVFVDESLADGYPKNNKKLASIIDASRSGSYNRGHQTQDGGVVGKYMQRISTELKIEPGDCGSTLYYPIEVTKGNAENLSGLYYKNGDKLDHIVDGNALIGKTILVRTPIFCRYPRGTYCGTCCGKNLETKKTGLNLVLMDIGANILKSSLKKMHNSQINTGKFGITDMIK